MGEINKLNYPIQMHSKVRRDKNNNKTNFLGKIIREIKMENSKTRTL